MTNSQILKQIRRFLTSDKPAELLPIDVLQAIRLLLQSEDEKDKGPSQATLAKQLASSRDSVIRSQARLKAAGVLTTTTGGYWGFNGSCYGRYRHTSQYTVTLPKDKQTA
jgi:hypothetical protein